MTGGEAGRPLCPEPGATPTPCTRPSEKAFSQLRAVAVGCSDPSRRHGRPWCRQACPPTPSCNCMLRAPAVPCPCARRRRRGRGGRPAGRRGVCTLRSIVFPVSACASPDRPSAGPATFLPILRHELQDFCTRAGLAFIRSIRSAPNKLVAVALLSRATLRHGSSDVWDQ